MKPHAEFDRLLAASQRLFRAGAMTKFRQFIYRAAYPEHSDLPAFISCEGSKLHGSRWNAPGTFRVLHAADTPENAVSEMLAAYRRYNLPLPTDLHMVIRSIRCEVDRMLDLRDGEIRSALRVSEERVLGDWMAENNAGHEAVSQAVGRAAAAAGFRGLLAPSSAVPGSTNTVVFVDRLGSTDRLTI